VRERERGREKENEKERDDDDDNNINIFRDCRQDRSDRYGTARQQVTTAETAVVYYIPCGTRIIYVRASDDDKEEKEIYIYIYIYII
jgi:hypothetical protein